MNTNNAESQAAAGRLIGSALALRESPAQHISPDSALTKRYGSHGADSVDPQRVVAHLLTRGAQSPAMSNAPGWAQELVQQSVVGFIDLAASEKRRRATSSCHRFDASPGGPVKRSPVRGVKPPGLAAAFRAEGCATIRVGATSLSSATLTPKSMGVITTLTNEMLGGAVANVEAIVQGAAGQRHQRRRSTLFFQRRQRRSPRSRPAASPTRSTLLTLRLRQAPTRRQSAAISGHA